jgi:hypothetical protein
MRDWSIVRYHEFYSDKEHGTSITVFVQWVLVAKVSRIIFDKDTIRQIQNHHERNHVSEEFSRGKVHNYEATTLQKVK